MLKSSKQTRASFHAELYNLIPQDHLLREINDKVNFGFIHDAVEESYCVYYGRPANEPELLFRLLFIQFLYKLSDERIIQESRVNLAYKWFLGLNPEDPLPDPSQLSRFRNHRLGANHVEKLLDNLVRQCVELKLLSSKALLVDSTHTLANTQNRQALDVLKDAAKRLHRSVVKTHPKLKTKLPATPKLSGEQADQEKSMLHYLADLGEVVEGYLPDAEGAIREKLEIAKRIVEDERLLARKGIQSAIDPDARFGWKSSTKSFFGYKEHLAMSEEEIITAVVVTHGAADDGKQLPELFSATLKNGVEVEEVLADTAYSSSDNLKLLQQENVIATIPLNPSVYGSNGTGEDGFSYIKDADAMQCPAGHLSVRKAKQGKKGAKKNQQYTYYFDTDKCKACPLRDGCYKPGARTKTYSIRILSDHHAKQIEYTRSSEFQTRKHRRSRIEHKNAELKIHHGMTRARYRGLFGMKIQAVLTAFVVNAKRMVKLLNEETRTSDREVRVSYYKIFFE
jgi:transposase